MQNWTRSSRLLQGRSLHVDRYGTATTTTTRSFASLTRRDAPHTDHVQVPCASAGHVTVSLHNVSKHPVSTPLIINLPAYPAQHIADVDSYLPSFLHQYPSATIHYRWSKGRDSESWADEAPSSSGRPLDTIQPIPTPLQWPTPITDTLIAYDFLRKRLSPSAQPGGNPLQRRNVYVHGSYLGASLAASLALTETHAHKPVAIRGVSAYNGIYNWTTFLPDHRMNRLLLADDMLGIDIDKADEDVAFLRDLMPTLFSSPADMFDPFASPVLFFHTSGLMVPPSFTESWTPPHLSPGYHSAARTLSPGGSDSVDNIDPYDYVYSDPEDPLPPALYPEVETELEEHLESSDKPIETDEIASLSDASSLSSLSSSSVSSSDISAAATTIAKPPNPRKGYLAFPPRWSTLKIPEALLLHSTAPPGPKIPEHIVGKHQLVLWKKLKNAENSFDTHALGLGSLMRRSVNKLELKERMRWDEDFDNWDGEAAKRVRIEDVGERRSGDFAFSVGERAEEIAAQWLEERMF